MTEQTPIQAISTEAAQARLRRTEANRQQNRENYIALRELIDKGANGQLGICLVNDGSENKIAMRDPDLSILNVEEFFLLGANGNVSYLRFPTDLDPLSMNELGKLLIVRGAMHQSDGPHTVDASFLERMTIDHDISGSDLWLNDFNQAITKINGILAINVGAVSPIVAKS